jgi:hypothetical protein
MELGKRSDIAYQFLSAIIVSNKLHIVALTVPYPPDYGGVTDLFYKLSALQSKGIQIHLHCFDYGRGRQRELERYCASVAYYERTLHHTSITNRLPYIVSSRRNEQLLQRLLQDDFPILLEGVHCSWLLQDKRFANRRCFLRLHNVEYLYYDGLYRSSSSLLKKIYYWLETRLLKRWEKMICDKAFVFTVSASDVETYRKLGCHNIAYLPLFIPGWKIDSQTGMGRYCLYHGDLSVDANEEAVRWLLKKVFSKLSLPLIIAGKDPSDQLAQLIGQHQHAQLVANPNDNQLQELIVQAHIHVLPAYTKTGIKIKLLNALYNGRHCVVNPAMIEGSGLDTLCHTGTTANAFAEIIAQLYHQPFSQEEIDLRKKILEGRFNNTVNAERMIARIWP